MAFLRTSLFHALKAMDAVATHFPNTGRFQPLRGSFSALDELRKGTLSGEVIADRQSVGPCPPDSITLRSGMSQHDHQPWPIFWVRADNPRLVGKLLHWRDSESRICTEGCYHQTKRRRLGEDRLLAQMILPPPAELKGAWTSVVSNWGDGRNYYHWVTDNLTRLLLREKLPEPARVLIPSCSAPYIRESLEMLGVAEICEAREEANLQPERFYFCSPLAMTGVWNPLGYNWLRERFTPYFRPTGAGRPVFLTRRASTRVPEQLPEIETMFRDAGFDIVDCGTLGFREQIEAASGAPSIAGVHGAAMTNILWARPDTPVLELFQPAYLNACYEQIAFQGNLRYSAHVLAPGDDLHKISGWCGSIA